MLEKFSREHRERGIEAFLAERGVTYPNLVGGRESPAHDLYAVGSLPATILVGTDGTVLDFGAGIGGTQRLLEQARVLAAR